jgi:hypothetical protein
VVSFAAHRSFNYICYLPLSRRKSTRHHFSLCADAGLVAAANPSLIYSEILDCNRQQCVCRRRGRKPPMLRLAGSFSSQPTNVVGQCSRYGCVRLSAQNCNNHCCRFTMKAAMPRYRARYRAQRRREAEAQEQSILWISVSRGLINSNAPQSHTKFVALQIQIQGFLTMLGRQIDPSLGRVNPVLQMSST